MTQNSPSDMPSPCSEQPNIFLSPYKKTAWLANYHLAMCLFPQWTAKPEFSCLATTTSDDGPKISKSIHSLCHPSGDCLCVSGDQGVVLSSETLPVCCPLDATACQGSTLHDAAL